MTAEETVGDISLGKFARLDERGLIAQNVLCVYFELDPGTERVGTGEVFRRIAHLEGWTGLCTAGSAAL